MSRSLRSRSLPSVCLGLVLALVGASDAFAGGTRTFHLGTFDAFDEGEAEGVAIEGSGRVTVGYAADRTDLEGSSSIFTCTASGADAWVGTADTAKIFKAAVRGGKAKLTELAKLDGAVVSTIAELPNGDLVAATLPGNKIVRVDGKGKVSDFAELPEAELIWSLKVHAKKVWAATGPKGELFQIDLDGKNPTVVLDVEEKNLLSMAVVDGEVVVGTSPKARLYQVSKDKEGVLLKDFAGDEIRGIAASGSHLAVAVNEFEDRSVSSQKSLEKQLARTSLSGSPSSSTTTEASTPKATARVMAVDLGKSVDLARASEAAWEEWLERKKQYFTSALAADDDGTVLVSSSREGKVYRVRGRRDVATVADLEERQATALCAVGKDILATTGDGAGAYVLHTTAAKKPKFITDVLDAKHPADYGAVVLRTKGKVTLRARTGPSDEPDDRWSNWRAIPLKSSNDGLRGALGTLPRRRYLQLEVSLASADAELRDVKLFYAPENLPPLVKKITVDGPDFDIEDDEEPKGEAKITWNVEAVDGDDLSFDVRIRPEGSADDEWMQLNEDGPLSKKELELELQTMPDGVYEVEVVASDAPTNGTAKAAKDELVSEPFVVDRGRPVISGATVQGDVVRGIAKDDGSYINDVAFSLDGAEFQAASPSDGIFDDASERFELQLPTEGLAPGVHRLVIRARDAHGNLSTVAVRVKR